MKAPNAGRTMAALRAAGFRPRVISPAQDGLIYQVPNLLSPLAARTLFEDLRSSPDWQTEVDAFGPQQRATAYYGDQGAIFSYVGLRLEPRSWPYALGEARRRADLLAAAHGLKSLTACLANFYPENAGSIPWHSDEVRAHGDARLVLAVSLGGTRHMLLRRKRPGSSPSSQRGAPLTLRLAPGSAVAMAGAAQDLWEHCLPLQAGSGVDAPARISLTFRSIVCGYEEGREPPTPMTA